MKPFRMEFITTYELKGIAQGRDSQGCLEYDDT